MWSDGWNPSNKNGITLGMDEILDDTGVTWCLNAHFAFSASVQACVQAHVVESKDPPSLAWMPIFMVISWDSWDYIFKREQRLALFLHMSLIVFDQTLNLTLEKLRNLKVFEQHHTVSSILRLNLPEYPNCCSFTIIFGSNSDMWYSQNHISEWLKRPIFFLAVEPIGTCLFSWPIPSISIPVGKFTPPKGPRVALRLWVSPAVAK